MKSTSFMKIIIIFTLIITLFGNIYAFGNGFDSSQVNVDTDFINNSNIKTTSDKIFNTILILLQVLSIAGIVFTGVKYMYSDASKKAEIKQSMIALAIGMAIVFAASSIVQFVTNVAKSAI